MAQDAGYCFEQEFLELMRPEDQIIVLSAKNRIDPSEGETISRLLNQNLDWDYLFRSVVRSGTLPLLYSNLYSQFSLLAPEAVVNRFANRAQMINARNLILTNELRRVMDLLQKNHIQAIPYKGPGLAAAIYGNIALRHFTDLDFLVKYSEIQKAKSLLLADGYRPADEMDPMTPSQERAFLHSHYTYDFHGREQSNRLEMHWGIVPRYFGFALDYEALWARATTYSFFGKDILTLAPEDSLLILCVSGTKHLWNRLSRICDVAETVRNYPELNWNLLILEARKLGVLRIVLLALYLSKKILNTPIPEEVWREVENDPVVPKLGMGLIQHLFPQNSAQAGFLDEDAQFQPLFLSVRERRVDKFRYLARVLSTPGLGEWKIVTLPGFLYFFYYFIRPIRLVFKYARRSVKLKRTAVSGH